MQVHQHICKYSKEERKSGFHIAVITMSSIPDKRYLEFLLLLKSRHRLYLFGLIQFPSGMESWTNFEPLFKWQKLQGTSQWFPLTRLHFARLSTQMLQLSAKLPPKSYTSLLSDLYISLRNQASSSCGFLKEKNLTDTDRNFLSSFKREIYTLLLFYRFVWYNFDPSWKVLYLPYYDIFPCNRTLVKDRTFWV